MQLVKHAIEYIQYLKDWRRWYGFKLSKTFNHGYAGSETTHLKGPVSWIRGAIERDVWAACMREYKRLPKNNHGYSINHLSKEYEAFRKKYNDLEKLGKERRVELPTTSPADRQRCAFNAKTDDTTTTFNSYHKGNA